MEETQIARTSRRLAGVLSPIYPLYITWAILGSNEVALALLVRSTRGGAAGGPVIPDACQLHASRNPYLWHQQALLVALHKSAVDTTPPEQASIRRSTAEVHGGERRPFLCCDYGSSDARRSNVPTEVT